MMTIDDMIEYLVEHGFEVKRPKFDEVDPYMIYGEQWENNPWEYAEMINEDRETWFNRFNNTDLAKMVETWSDKTLFSVQRYGSDLAMGKAQRFNMKHAVESEIQRRRNKNKPNLGGLSLGDWS